MYWPPLSCRLCGLTLETGPWARPHRAASPGPACQWALLTWPGLHTRTASATPESTSEPSRRGAQNGCEDARRPVSAELRRPMQLLRGMSPSPSHRLTVATPACRSSQKAKPQGQPSSSEIQHRSSGVEVRMTGWPGDRNGQRRQQLHAIGTEMQRQWETVPTRVQGCSSKSRKP